MLATWHWHIEISSKCPLKCSRCARQEVPSGLINTELDLDFFKRNFTRDFIIANVEKITFCGDDGDPIYAHDLIEVIKYIKSIKPVEFVIITNGSHKKVHWWKELGQMLDKNDTVHFSLDGWDNPSNAMYRKSGDFMSAIDGIVSLKNNSQVKLVWAAIAFKFNEDRIDYMRQIAQSLKMDRFQLTKSTKFGSVYPVYGEDDPLQPSERYVSSTHRFEREITSFTERGQEQTISLTNIKLYEQYKNNADIVPLCAIGTKGLYIDARGRLFPCCWVANRYDHNNEWQTIAENFNLHSSTLEQALNDNFWVNEFQSFKWQECRTKCKKAVVNQEYATSW
jgi:MoaA/NifB/PqqE/SkfB family radical SAM enzyme